MVAEREELSVERSFTSTGFVQEVPGHVDRVPEFDPRSGEHLWTMTMAYQVDPAKMMSGADGPVLFDKENLLVTAGPGCYYCERPYSPRLAMRRCKGEPQ